MRYALYFTPDADSSLNTTAASWLGRDVLGSEPEPVDLPPGILKEEWKNWTAEPRRYGFHATLVAPFRLRSDLNETDVVAEAEALANRQTAFTMPQMAVTSLGRFIALTLMTECSSLQELAADAVDQFTPLRAPLTDADIARRRPELLTERQRDYLTRFGYPYVRDEFRFHFSLTGSLAAVEDQRLEPYLQSYFTATLQQPLQFDSVSLFIEPEPGAPFLFHSRHRFPAGATMKSVSHAP
jgi:putative phosphonate metabolism protein